MDDQSPPADPGVPQPPGGMRRTLDQAFIPTGQAWQPVSPRLTTARRITTLLVMLPLLVGIVVLAVFGPPWLALALAVAWLIVLLWAMVLIGRRVRSFGYAERDDDLLVTSGIWVRRLVVVPYGRMQLVDITAGPIDRALGLGTVQLHTAAATTQATIPGLPGDVSAALRDRLAARGEERSAGL